MLVSAVVPADQDLAVFLENLDVVDGQM